MALSPDEKNSSKIRVGLNVVIQVTIFLNFK